MSNVSILKKISIGLINNVRKGFRKVTAPKLQGRIYGVARSAKPEETDNGMAFKFTGDFRAINAEGVHFVAPVLFLVGEAQAVLAQAVAADKSGSGIEFAFDFITVPDAGTLLGYKWETPAIFDPVQADPFHSVHAKLTAHPMPTSEAGAADAAGNPAEGEKSAEETGASKPQTRGRKAA